MLVPAQDALGNESTNIGGGRWSLGELCFELLDLSLESRNQQLLVFELLLLQRSLLLFLLRLSLGLATGSLDLE